MSSSVIKIREKDIWIPVKQGKYWEQFQPNMLTNARYHYSAIAKNVLYYIIDFLQKAQIHEIDPQRDLFENLTVTIDISKIAKSNNYDEVWDAIYKELMERTIHYTYDHPQTKERVEVKAVLIPYMERVKGRKEITIAITPNVVPILLFLGQGFTAYSKTVAIALPSVYSKRIYECCCRWKDTGVWIVNIAEFRILMNCTDKFKQMGQLKEFVIDKAINDINKTSELYTSYILVKGKAEGRGATPYKFIKFFIEPKKTDKKNYFNEYRFVYNFLAGIYAGEAALHITDWLMDNKHIAAANDRFERLQTEISTSTEGKNKKRYYNYILAILPDFGVPKELLPCKKEGKKK